MLFTTALLKSNTHHPQSSALFHDALSFSVFIDLLSLILLKEIIRTENTPLTKNFNLNMGYV